MKKNDDFTRILAQYRDKYDVDNLTNPNDLANLETMIRNQLLIEKLQNRLDILADNADFDSTELKKVLDGITALSQTNVQLERTLGIDRKTRKADQAETFVDVVLELKKMGREFLEARIIRVMCKKCEIMVGRIAPVYDTTEFSSAFQCPQCKKFITITRKERDIFFDVKNADWRRKFPMEVIQAKRTTILEEIEDDVILPGMEDDVEYGEV